MADATAMDELEQISMPGPWSAAQFAASLAESTTRALLAETELTLTGFLLARIAAGECEILRLAVDPAWRRAGIGGELVARTLLGALGEGASEAFLEVRNDNIPARRLYERLGFRLAGARPAYYSDGADAVNYRRALPAGVVGLDADPMLFSKSLETFQRKERVSMPNLDDLKADLLRTNDDFRQLYEEHQECEDRLQELVQKTLPSQEDEAEEKRLKIHKLALKDRMEAMVREHRLAV